MSRDFSENIREIGHKTSKHKNFGTFEQLANIPVCIGFSQKN